MGSPLPSGQSVSVNKSGVDGTYYSVTTAGAATSSVTGRYNAFDVGSAGTKAMNVGLAAGSSTATAGLRSGMVTIDNLDVTLNGGSGMGANDDVMSVSLSVLDHANPSFAGMSDLNSLSYDFGTVLQGSSPQIFSFDLFNLSSTAGFTAGIDPDAVLGSGDSGVLSTNLLAISRESPLDAGSSWTYLASLNTATPGSFSASYTLHLSDENLVGAMALEELTLNLTGVVQPAFGDSADFNGDGTVDGADLPAWQQGLGTIGATRGDGVVNGGDLPVWRDQFGGAMTTAAPEPSGALLAISAIAVAIQRRRLCSS